MKNEINLGLCGILFRTMGTNSVHPLRFVDTLSGIFGFCDCGSNYKSWSLVCRLWNRTAGLTFQTPKRVFGNKLINIIDDIDCIDLINGDEILQSTVRSNPRVPLSWKKEHNLLSINTSYPYPHYTLEEMDYRVSKLGKPKFSSEMLFYRPFKDDVEFLEFFIELKDLYKYRFIYPIYFYFHHSVSIQAIRIVSEYVNVNWQTVPITHHGYLSSSDWEILDDFYVVPPNVDCNSNLSCSRLYYWARYPTTTPEMISQLKLKNTSKDKLLVVCPNSSHQQVVDAIKGSNDKERILSLLLSIDL